MSDEAQQRYTAERVDNHAWGGVQWAIWDHELDTWADDLGRWLSDEGARQQAQFVRALLRGRFLEPAGVIGCEMLQLDPAGDDDGLSFHAVTLSR